MISVSGLTALVVTAVILAACVPLILVLLFILDFKSKEIW